jgi:O-methyltransferase
MIKRIAKGALRRMGYALVNVPQFDDNFPQDFEPEFKPIYRAVHPFTMTPLQAVHAMYLATKYVVDAGIAGDVVECGVWRGGSAMTGALTLKARGDIGRKLFLYDTYEGMVRPTEKDVFIYDGVPAIDTYNSAAPGSWCYASLEDVQRNMGSTGYPADRLVYVKGKVEETIPGVLPGTIALLRLDTDWYDSTYHELVHMFPRLSPGGVLIIDDYGSWSGAREATDKYFAENDVHMLMNRLDNGGRIGVKPR